MITEIETGIDNSTWDAQGYVKIYTDRPLGDGTPVSILKALADEIDEDLERREEENNAKAFSAKMAIYRAADRICKDYGVKLTVEVSE